MASRSALRQPIQKLLLPVSRKPDHYYLSSRPPSFSKPSCCANLPSDPPSHSFTPLRPLSFCKHVRHLCSPPTFGAFRVPPLRIHEAISMGGFYAQIGAEAWRQNLGGFCGRQRELPTSVPFRNWRPRLDEPLCPAKPYVNSHLLLLEFYSSTDNS